MQKGLSSRKRVNGRAIRELYFGLIKTVFFFSNVSIVGIKNTDARLYFLSINFISRKAISNFSNYTFVQFLCNISFCNTFF